MLENCFQAWVINTSSLLAIQMSPLPKIFSSIGKSVSCCKICCHPIIHLRRIKTILDWLVLKAPNCRREQRLGLFNVISLTMIFYSQTPTSTQPSKKIVLLLSICSFPRVVFSWMGSNSEKLFTKANVSRELIDFIQKLLYFTERPLPSSNFFCIPILKLSFLSKPVYISNVPRNVSPDFLNQYYNKTYLVSAVHYLLIEW